MPAKKYDEAMTELVGLRLRPEQKAYLDEIVQTYGGTIPDFLRDLIDDLRNHPIQPWEYNPGADHDDE